MASLPIRFRLSLPLAVAAVAALAPAQARLPRAAARELAAVIARSPQAIGNQLCVKLREGSGAELEDGVLRSRTGVDLAPVAALFGKARVSPLFSALSWDELDRWHRRACANLPPDNRPGHLGLWFLLETATVEEAACLFDRLWSEPRVECVVPQGRGTPAGSLGPMPAVMPGDIPPPTPNLTTYQLTFGPSPNGHGIWDGQTVLGARGRGVKLHIVEIDWDLDHEDLSQVVAASIIGTRIPTPGQSAHGTAVASIAVADRNGYGFTGVSDEAALALYPEGGNGGIPNAMLLAGAQAQPGDVVMLVMMYQLAQIGGQDWVPFEILQPVFDATLTLTGNGINVVATAGNGDNNLDDPRFMRLFDRTFRDSGAVLVGASDGVNPVKAAFSNYGSRVDANSWGENVCMCGGGNLFFPNNDIRQAYSNGGRGTSASTPAIAGLVAALEGAAELQLGRRLTPAEIRQALHAYGPVSPDPIGRRVDLFAALQGLGILDGLMLSEPDVALGGSADVTVTGPPGAGAFLFSGFDVAVADLGFDRAIHLPLGAITMVGFQPLPAGSASFPIAVPNDAGLRGLDLFFQAGVFAPGQPVHVTNSGQLTIY